MAKKVLTTQQIIAIAITVLAVIMLGLWLLYTEIYLKPSTVFWSTINQNLQTGYISKTVTQTTGTQTLTEATNIQFKGSLIAHTTLILTNKSGLSTSSVITETYGTDKQDFLRYTEIKSSTSANPKNTINVWAVNNKNNQQIIEILSDALMSSPLMYGYLSSSQRADIINQMHDHNVFTINFANTSTNVKYDGKRIYTYDVAINLQSYVQVFRAYLQDLGQSNLALQIGQPAAGSTYKATLYINPASRQILKMVPDGSSISEIYSNQDINAQTKLPVNVKLSITELKQRLTD
jgi:hypothetical protein